MTQTTAYKKSVPTMMTYIQETPEALVKAFQNKEGLVGELCSAYKAAGEKNICLIACGSSKNAAYVSAPFMCRTLKARVEVVPSASFVYDPEPLDPQVFYVVISQSGCSTNSLDALKKIATYNKAVVQMGYVANPKRAAVFACGLTTHPEAEISQFGLPVFDWGCGSELVGYVCKGVVTLAHYLMLFSVAAGVAKGSMSQVEAQIAYQELESVPELHLAMQQSATAFYYQHERTFLGMGATYVVGVGPAWGVAREGALKLGETVKIPAVDYELDEFAHGPNLQMTPSYTVFFVDPLSWSAAASARTRQLACAYQMVSSQVFLIGACEEYRSELENSELLNAGRILFAPTKTSPRKQVSSMCNTQERAVFRAYFSPLYTLAAFEIFAYRTAEAKGSWNELELVARAANMAPTKTKTFREVMPL